MEYSKESEINKSRKKILIPGMVYIWAHNHRKIDVYSTNKLKILSDPQGIILADSNQE